MEKNPMTANELKKRMKDFGISTLKLVDQMPKSYSSLVISRQITRSASSCGANYRAACRSKSTKDFINKLKVVEEELDETDYWLEVIQEMKFLAPEQLRELKKEGTELLSIIVKSLVTAKANFQINSKRN
jgi:four helix bundle protein